MNKNTKILLVIICLLTLGVVGFTYFGFWGEENDESDGVQTPLEVIHIHAVFNVYKDDQKQDFSDLKYMRITPCSEELAEPDPAEEQIEKAHLHDFVGEVVHVHRKGATWADLFRNLNYDLGENVSGYVDGEFTEDILNSEIVADSRVLILAGENSDHESKLAALPGLQLIREVELSSENCGT